MVGRLAVLVGLGLLVGCGGTEERALEAVKDLQRCEAKGDPACVAAALDLDRKARELLGPLYGTAGEGQRAAFRELLARLVVKSITLRKRQFPQGPGTLEAKAEEGGLVTVTETAPGGRFAYVYLVDPGAGRVLDRGHSSDGRRADPGLVVRRFAEHWKGRTGAEPTLDDYLREFESFTGQRTLRTWQVPGKVSR